MRRNGSSPTRTPAPQLSRRGLLLASAGAGAGTLLWGFAACSSEGESMVPARSGATHALLAAFPQIVPHVPVGVPMRLPYLVSDAEGVPLAELTGPVDFEVSRDGTVIDTLQVAPRSEGIPRAYLPLTTTFDAAGVYDITADYDGERMQSQVQAFPAEEITPPVVGQQLPPAPTPTTDATLQVDPICTLVPPCPFHEVNLEDAVGTGVPIVVLVATPAYCQTAACGPTLGNLIDIVGDRDDIVVIHAEVYQDPKADAEELETAALAPLPEDYGLAFEPVMYVTDAEGAITARADVMIDRSEMAELLPPSS